MLASNSQSLIIELEEQLEDTRDQMHEHQAHLGALENGETFVPTLKKNKSPVGGKKRKSTGKMKQGPTKRRRSVASEADEEDELMESDEDLSSYSVDSDSDVAVTIMRLRSLLASTQIRVKLMKKKKSLI